MDPGRSSRRPVAYARARGRHLPLAYARARPPSLHTRGPHLPLAYARPRPATPRRSRSRPQEWAGHLRACPRSPKQHETQLGDTRCLLREPHYQIQPYSTSCIPSWPPARWTWVGLTQTWASSAGRSSLALRFRQYMAVLQEPLPSSHRWCPHVHRRPSTSLMDEQTNDAACIAFRNVL